MGLMSGVLGNACTVDSATLGQKYSQLLTENEEFEVGFQVIRDTFVFTNKRLILVNVQGITGKKTEYLSIPYGKITKFSIETAGSFDVGSAWKEIHKFLCRGACLTRRGNTGILKYFWFPQRCQA